MQRLYQFVLVGSFLPLCWFGMMAVHEFGHVLGAFCTGGTISKVVLYPLTISRTDLSSNPHPLLVVWAGPVFGVLFPLAGLGIAVAARLAGSYLVRFFAGFCLVANGAYIGVGSFDGIGDAGDMLRHGSPIWLLWAFGVVTVPLGLLFWHRLGPHFGVGRVGQTAAFAWLALLVVVVGLELMLGGE